MRLKPRLVFRVMSANSFYDWGKKAFPVYAISGSLMIVIGWERL